jgi:hypothetical protein
MAKHDVPDEQTGNVSPEKGIWSRTGERKSKNSSLA